MGTVLLLVLLLAVLLAARADAKPQIKVNCDVYAENYVDPIAFASHLHRQIGNTSTTNSSTGDSLFNNPSTSCDESWFTSAGWFPVERNESVKGVNVYYRAPGDPTKIKAIPKGLQLLATKQSANVSGAKYNCNEGPFQNTRFTAVGPVGPRRSTSPTASTRAVWQTSLPTRSTAGGVCPSTHPYRIPRINYLVMLTRPTARFPTPLWERGRGRVGGLYPHARRLLRGEPARLQRRAARPLLEERPG